MPQQQQTIHHLLDHSLTGLQQTRAAVQLLLQRTIQAFRKDSFEDAHQMLTQIKPINNLVKLHSQQLKKISKLQKMIGEDRPSSSLDILFQKPLDDRLMYEVISQSLLYQGYSLDQKKNNQHLQITTITQSIRQGQLNPSFLLLEEAENFAGESAGTILKYRLHRQKAIELGRSSKTSAISYCKEHLSVFTSLYAEDIKKTLSSLIISSSEQHNEYFSQNMRDELASLFCKEVSKLYKMPSTDPLALLLQQASSLKHMVQQKGLSLSSLEELEQEVGQVESKYHSIFVCPVTKEMADDENPPIALSCGHVISKKSLSQIQSMSRIRENMRCPLCRKRVVIDEGVRLMI